MDPLEALRQAIARDEALPADAPERQWPVSSDFVPVPREAVLALLADSPT